jgi:predicted nucleic acid-binding protein
MAAECFWDTSGFFALLNTDDPAHSKSRQLAAASLAEHRRIVTSDWVIGECCTLLIARRKPHLVRRFLDYTDQGAGLLVVPGETALMSKTKNFLRERLDHAYSFVDCASFVIMAERGILEAATTDEHFAEAGFVPLLR